MFARKLTARQKAHDLVARASAFQKEKAKAASVDAEKTARLRALRLAKEAADREAAEIEVGAAAADPKDPAPPMRKIKKINVAP